MPTAAGLVAHQNFQSPFNCNVFSKPVEGGCLKIPPLKSSGLYMSPPAISTVFQYSPFTEFCFQLELGVFQILKAPFYVWQKIKTHGRAVS